MIDCECERCLEQRAAQDERGWPATMIRMIVCQSCGNKRCPHATDHRNRCTGSNAPGQPGSSYADVPTVSE